MHEKEGAENVSISYKIWNYLLKKYMNFKDTESICSLHM